MSTPQPLVHATRGRDGVEAVESVHVGSVAVVDWAGRLVAHAGDACFPTFSRSTIKPFQALPFLHGGGPAHYGFGAPQLALMCASHSGEPVHVGIVAAMLRAAGCGEHHLQCGCHVPLRFAATGTVPAVGETFGPLHNNCSGKHAGFLAHCAQDGLALDDYLDAAHPLQRGVRAMLAEACDTDPDAMAMGIDGCSAPNYALPLAKLALGFARLAVGIDRPAASAGADRHAAALAVLRDAMMAHPELVSGAGRNDAALMRAKPGDWVAKAGADGVQLVGVRSAGLGIAVKIAGGDSRAAGVATIETLRQLGLIDEAGIAACGLADWAAPALRNLRGTITGHVRPVLRLCATPAAA